MLIEFTWRRPMPGEMALEALATEQLRADVTRLIAERLAAPLEAGAKSHRSKAVRPQSPEVGPGARSSTLKLKARTVTGPQLLEAVHAAIGQLLGDRSQLLVLRNANPELAPIVTAVLEQVPRAVRARRQILTEQHIDALVNVYMANDPLSTALPDLERDNAEAQASFLKRWPVLTAEQLAERARHGSTNRSATATRWKSVRKIFGVRTGRREVYPAFQFREGQPRAVIGHVLEALPSEISLWQTAFWFVAPNGWLDGAAPVERLDDEASVREAAVHEGEAWMG